MERLLDEPWSRWRAKELGGDHWREHLGWTPDTYLHATLIDAVQANSAITAVHGSRKRPKRIQPVPRPTFAVSEPVDPEELEEQALLDAEAFLNDDD